MHTTYTLPDDGVRQSIAFARQPAGTIIDVFAMATGATGATEAHVDFDGPDGPAGVVATNARQDFQRCRLHLKAAADRLSYAPDTTAVSVVYAYDPDAVLREGITILHAGPAPTPESLVGYHFRPPFGWMNDPNGFGRFGDRVHLFYQHYPHSLRWHAMHWGHAVSDDMVRWRHLPIFLEPGEETLIAAHGHGGAFSGSAIALPGGDGLRAFFTDHVEGRSPEMEIQRSVRAGDAITAEAPAVVLRGRPEGLGLSPDNRDPYVFTGPDGRLRMLLGSRDDTGGVVLLYETDDPDGLSGWRFSSVLHHEGHYRKTVAECPSMVPLDGPADDPDTRWALVFGLLHSRDIATRRRHLSIALVGRFDGRVLTVESRHELDFGTDAYGFQAFADRDGAVAIAWLANWVDIVRTEDCPTAMTLPRRLVLDGGQLRTPPVDAVESLRREMLDDGAFAAGLPVALPGGGAEIRIELARPGCPFSVVFDHPSLGLGVRADERGLSILFETDGTRSLPDYVAAGASVRSIRIFVDRGSIEVFADDGLLVGTKRLPGDAPVTAARLVADRDDVSSVMLWRLAL